MIDTTNKDELLEAGLSEEAKKKARSVIESFEQFIRENKNEITALQILYSRPYRQRLTFEEIKKLAETIARPPRVWTPERLWRAYEALDQSKVRGSGRRTLTDSVSLVRFAIHRKMNSGHSRKMWTGALPPGLLPKRMMPRMAASSPTSSACGSKPSATTWAPVYRL